MSSWGSEFLENPIHTNSLVIQFFSSEAPNLYWQIYSQAILYSKNGHHWRVPLRFRKYL